MALQSKINWVDFLFAIYNINLYIYNIFVQQIIRVNWSLFSFRAKSLAKLPENDANLFGCFGLTSH